MKSRLMRAVGRAARATVAAVRAAGGVLDAVAIAICILIIAAVGAIAGVLFTGTPLLVPGVIHLWSDASVSGPGVGFVPNPTGILVSVLALGAAVWVARRPPRGDQRRRLRPPQPPAPR